MPDTQTSLLTTRTKIVATLGPAVADEDSLIRLFRAGVDICRLNFSHSDFAAHEKMLGLVRKAAAKHEHPIAVLGDLPGPKIRLGEIADVGGTGGMPVEVGQILTFQRTPTIGADLRVSSVYPNFIDDIKEGDKILIEDGLLKFICTEKNYNELKAACLVGGILKTRKGINLPNSNLQVPSLTDRDWECVNWAIAHEIDFVALSFVRRAEDLLLLREHIRNAVADIHVIAKIEKSEAVANIDPILDACDGLMVARGDLGVEVDLATVPIIQKDLIRRCQRAGKPVIVATQMLQSMIEQASPTRAEVSDVANAVFDGADAVMLSGETSVGKFPHGTVHTMAHICATIETYLATQDDHARPELRLRTMQLSAAVARGVWQISQDIDIKLVIIWSQTGATARIFSKMRLHVPIIALSSDERALRKMNLNYGVVPLLAQVADDFVSLVRQVDKLVQEKSLARSGDRIVIVAGSSLGTPGTMNGVVIHTVGEVWTVEPREGQAP